MLVSSSRSFNRYRDVCFPKGQKLRADASSCRKILEAADCRGWQRGKTKLFLKYEHIKNLVGVLDKKAAEEDARLAAIEASRAKREAEERAFEERRAKEVAVIRKAAEAQPSATQKENEAAAELAKLAKKKKPKKLPPTVFEKSSGGSGGGGGGGGSAAKKEPPPIKPRMSRRNTGMKGKKFTVGALANRFAGSKRRKSRGSRASMDAAAIAAIAAQAVIEEEEAAAAAAAAAAPKEPCGNYRLDMLAASFGDCKCGFSKALCLGTTAH